MALGARARCIYYIIILYYNTRLASRAFIVLIIYPTHAPRVFPFSLKEFSFFPSFLWIFHIGRAYIDVNSNIFTSEFTTSIITITDINFINLTITSTLYASHSIKTSIFKQHGTPFHTSKSEHD